MGSFPYNLHGEISVDDFTTFWKRDAGASGGPLPGKGVEDESRVVGEINRHYLGIRLIHPTRAFSPHSLRYHTDAFTTQQPELKDQLWGTELQVRMFFYFARLRTWSFHFSRSIVSVACGTISHESYPNALSSIFDPSLFLLPLALSAPQFIIRTLGWALQALWG